MDLCADYGEALLAIAAAVRREKIALPRHLPGDSLGAAHIAASAARAFFADHESLIDAVALGRVFLPARRAYRVRVGHDYRSAPGLAPFARPSLAGRIKP